MCQRQRPMLLPCSHRHLRLHRTSVSHHVQLHRLQIQCSNSLILLRCSLHQCMNPVIHSSYLAYHDQLERVFRTSSRFHSMQWPLVDQWSHVVHSLIYSQCPIILSGRQRCGLDPLRMGFQGLVNQVPMVDTTCVLPLEHLSIYLDTEQQHHILWIYFVVLVVILFALQRTILVQFLNTMQLCHLGPVRFHNLLKDFRFITVLNITFEVR